MKSLTDFANELEAELDRILGFWLERTFDEENGGFIGQIDYNGNRIASAHKGAVLNSRILWTFSAAYNRAPDEKYREAAKRAFDYINNHFYNPENRGIFWSLDEKGRSQDAKNQIYALAFAIYGLSEYFAAFSDEAALSLAKVLFDSIETHSYDVRNGGYFEAFSRDWQPLSDLRLSEKDANANKTMNTHLHIVEAYANLYKVWKNDRLKKAISGLLHTIDARFIDKTAGHLKLFFDQDWVEKPDVISYGHDIEAAWLLLWCAEIIQDQKLTETFRRNAVLLADATIEAIDTDGGLWYEFDPIQNKLVAEKHWWPQSEMQLGFFTAWEITGKKEYLEVVLKNWEFTKKYLLDLQAGEWFWGIYSDYSHIIKDKMGFWKCPYHNSRACLELINRIKKNNMKKITANLIALGLTTFFTACRSDDNASEPVQPQPEPSVLTPANVRTYMVDANSTDETVALFYNLKSLSATGIAVGQQDAFNGFYGAAGESDMKKTTGSDPALLGSDFMFITDKNHEENPSNWFYQQEIIITEDAKEAYSKGMINTFCWHLREPFNEDSFYAADMTEIQKYSAFPSILPGGENHDWFKAKLDKVADVLNNLKDANGVAIPVIFRPFHEFDGNWFWWGAAYSTAAQYKQAYQFVVTYLRDIKNVHNVLYAFSPDNSYTTQDDYLSRYPGDDYVDILGMDNYGDLNNQGWNGSQNASNKLGYLSDLAIAKVKIAALTETGYRVTNSTAPVSGWFSDYLYSALTSGDTKIAYVMFWNNNADGYYVPAPGAPNAADFISFTDKPEMVLENELPSMYTMP